MPKYTVESYARRVLQPTLKKQGYALSVEDITEALFHDGDFRFEPAENKIYAPFSAADTRIIHDAAPAADASKSGKRPQRKPAAREQIHQRLVHYYALKVFPGIKAAAKLPLKDYATRKEAKRSQLSLALLNDSPEEAAKGLDMYLAFLEENKEFFAFPGAGETDEEKEQRRHYSRSWIGNKASFASLRGHSKGVLHALDSLEWLLSEAGGEAGKAFAETIPQLYTFLGRDRVDEYLAAGMPLLHAYKSLPKRATAKRRNAAQKKLTDYLRLQGREAEQQLLPLVKLEHQYHLLVESGRRAERRERIQQLEERVKESDALKIRFESQSSELFGVREQLSEARRNLDTFRRGIEQPSLPTAPELSEAPATAQGEADKRSNKLFPYAIGAGAILVSAALVYGLTKAPELLQNQPEKAKAADVYRIDDAEDIPVYEPDAGVDEKEGIIIGPGGTRRVMLE